jgi:hypothetical protein
MESKKPLLSIDTKQVELQKGIDFIEVPKSIYEEIQEKRRQEAIDYIATIKTTLPTSEFEGLISKCGIIKRCPSPCPCKSKECQDEYLKEQKAYFSLLEAKGIAEKRTGFN